MKLSLIIGFFCCIGFIAGFGKEQLIRVSGKIQCCTEKELPEFSYSCLPPYKSDIKLYEKAIISSDKLLKTMQLENGDGEYLIEWKGETYLTIEPVIRVLVDCEEGQKEPFEYEYELINSDGTNFKQDIIVDIYEPSIFIPPPNLVGLKE